MLFATANKNVRSFLLWRGYFCLAVLGLVLLVCVSPQTGWIARRQLASQGSFADLLWGEPVSYPDTSLRYEHRREVATKYPSDFAVQYVWLQDVEVSPSPGAEPSSGPPDNVAWDAPARTERESKLRVLARVWERRRQFENQPDFYAGYLRAACAVDTNLGRDLECDLVTYGTLDAVWKFREQQRKSIATGKLPSLWQTSSEFAHRALQAGRKGEWLDPANSFFPAMQAAVLLAQKQDARALQALERAAAKPQWNDYLQTERDGRVRLTEFAEGPMSAGQRFLLRWQVNAPQLSTFRAIGEVATALAVLRERRQDFAGGVRIRKAIARLGMRLRVAAPYASANLCGVHLVDEAARYPGGMIPQTTIGVSGPPVSGAGSPPTSLSGPAPGDEAVEEYEGFSRRINKAPGLRYVSYLNGHGAADEARWYARESATANRVREISDSYNGSEIESPLYRLDVQWLTGSVLIAQTLYALMLGGVGAWVYRSAQVREGTPLGREQRWAFAMLPVSLIAGACVAGGAHYLCDIYCLYDLYYSLYPNLAGVVLGFAFLLLPLLWFRNPPQGKEWNRSQRKRRFRMAVKRYVQTLGLTAAIVIVTSVLTVAFLRGSVLSSYSGALGGTIPPGALAWKVNPVASALCTAALAWVPLCTLLTCIVSLARRIPISVGITRCAYQIAPRIAVAFLIFWIGSIVFTAYWEDKASHEVVAAAQHEGRHQATLVGATWPGVTPEVETLEVVGKGEQL